MIVVEGPDGAGKTSLIDALKKKFSLPVHERASSSMGGPVKDLFQWAYDDVTTQPSQPLSIYDRHPLISEYVYAPQLRHLAEEFTTTRAQLLIRMMSLQVHVVWCLPTFASVLDNVDRTNQMAGVRPNIHPIYQAYKTMMVFWPGISSVWSYDHPQASHANVFARVGHHITAERLRRK